MNKYLEYNDNKTIIKKDDGIGGIYYTETDKIDFGFKYDNLAYNEEKEDFAYCVKNNWLILDKDKIKTISDYIDNFEIPVDYYPNYYKNVNESIIHIMTNFINGCNCEKDTITKEDGTEVVVDNKSKLETKKLLEDSIIIFREENLTEDKFKNNVLTLINNIDKELFIEEYDNTFYNIFIESINSTVFLENYNILEYLDGIQ
jgi:hypothetical protein